MSTTNQAAALLLKLGYDSSDVVKGLSQSRQAVASFKADVVLIEQELSRERSRLATDYSAANRQQLQQRLADLRSALASETGSLAQLRGVQSAAARDRVTELRSEFAEVQKNLAQFDVQKQKVAELAAAKTAAQTNVQKSQAAAGIFRETGRATGEIPGLSDLVGNLAPGLSNIQSRLGGILTSLVILGGGVKGGSQAFGEMSAAGEGLSSTLGILSAGMIGTVSTIGAVGVAMVAGALSAGSWAHELTLLSEKTGISVDDLRGFQYVSSASGLNLEALTMATGRLSKAIVEGSPILKQYGIDAVDAGNNFRNPIDVLMDLSRVLKTLPEPEQINLVRELLGGRVAGQQLLPTLLRDDLEKLFATAKAGDTDIQDLNARFEQSALATSNWEKALHDLEARLGFSMGLWTAIKNLSAGMMNTTSQTPGPGMVEIGNVSDMFRGSPQTSPLPRFSDILKSSPLQPFSVSSKTAFPGSVPPSEEMVAGQEKVNDAKRKEAAIGEQILATQKKIDDLQTQIDTKTAQRNRTTDPAQLEEAGKAIGKIQDDQATAISKLISLQKEQTTAAKEAVAAAQKQLDLVIATANKAEELAATEAKIAELYQQQKDIVATGTTQRQGVMPQDRLTTINTVEAPKLRDQLATQTADPEAAAITAKQLEALEQEAVKLQDIIQTQKARDAVEEKLLDNQREMLSLAEKLAAINSGISPIAARTLSGAVPDLGGKLDQGPTQPSQTKFVLDQLDAFGKVVGKFSAGLDKQVVEVFASIDALSTSLKQLSKNADGSGGFGNIVGGIKGIASGARGISGVVGNIVNVGGAVGSIVGLASTVIGGLADLFDMHARKIADNIKDEVAAIDSAFKTGNLSITAAMTGLDTQKTSAMANLTGSNLQDVLTQINTELAALRAQQKTTLDSFNTQLATLESPVGLASFDSSFEQIITTLRTAAGAGASLTDQLNYLNLSVTQLATSMSTTLTTAEQGTLSLLKQDIDLQQQKADLQISYNEQRQAILSSAGLAPVLTAGQQVAQQLADLDRQHNEQVDAMTQQQNQLTAQLDGQAQLYGFSVKITDLETEKQAVIAAQLALQVQITQQQTLQTTQQMQLLALLNQGQIPNLTPGLIPSGPDFSQMLNLVEQLSIVNKNASVGATALTAVFGTSTPDSANVTLQQIQALIGALTGGPGTITGPGTANNSVFQLTGTQGATRDALVAELQSMLQSILGESYLSSQPTSFSPTLASTTLGGAQTSALGAWSAVSSGGLSGVPASAIPNIGSQVNNNIASLNITVNLPVGTTLTADQAAAIVRQGLTQIGSDGTLGLAV